jgi:HSP20 family protein
MTQVKFSRRPFDKNFNSLVDDLFSDLPVLFKNGPNHQDWKGSVPVNIKETGQSYVLDVVAPGFEKSDFKISLEQDTLTISAEKSQQVKNEDDKIIRNEYSWKSFKRSFTIDEKINEEGIEAKYVNGVLTLNLPRKEEVKTTSKDISVL